MKKGKPGYLRKKEVRTVTENALGDHHQIQVWEKHAASHAETRDRRGGIASRGGGLSGEDNQARDFTEPVQSAKKFLPHAGKNREMGKDGGWGSETKKKGETKKTSAKLKTGWKSWDAEGRKQASSKK